MKGKLSQERYIRATNTEKFSKSLPMIVSTLQFCKILEKNKAKEPRNVKYVTKTLLFMKLKLQ